MKRAFTIFLAMLMLTTFVGATFATHYCGGKAVKKEFFLFGLFDIGCGMGEKDNSCDNPEMPSMKSNCCQNKFMELAIEDDFNSPKIIKSTFEYNLVSAFVISYINRYSFDALEQAEYLNYSPPLLNLVTPVLVQSFLL